jgi:hypothetical protein
MIRGKRKMRIEIGNICINASDSKYLKRHGIYCIENFNDKIESQTPLDYDFMVINGKEGNILIDAIKCFFNNTWPSNPLIECINAQLGTDIVQSDDTAEQKKHEKAKIEQIIFNWLSLIIEKLPGRLIIIGGEKPNGWDTVRKENIPDDSKTGILKWITKRIVWEKEFEGFDIFLKKMQNGKGKYIELYSVNNFKKLEQNDLKLCLYNTWINSFHSGKKRKLEVVMNLSEKKKTLHIVKKNDVLMNIEKVKECLNRVAPKITYEDIINLFKEKNDININNIPGKITQKLFNGETSLQMTNCFGEMKTQKTDKIPHFFAENQSQATEQDLNFSLCSKKIESPDKKMKYSKHDEVSLKNKQYRYQESLSGSLAHFNILYNIFTGNNEIQKAGLYFNLIENGFVKIIVADERIANYVSQNPQSMEKYECGGIFVLKGIDGLLETSIENFCTGEGLKKFGDIKEEAQKRKYDIFIIHQGILDKTGLAIETIEEEINKWKKHYFSIVAVTSGRGTPANIPRNSRFIPFSILESTLLTSSISKLTLVNIIFKSLSGRN